MEIWDAYNSKLEKIDGVTLIRGRERQIPAGIYHIVCDVLVKHIDGTYLLMQRDPRKTFPKMWEASAGGSALKGETPIECARRELREETGILATELKEISRYTKEPTHGIHVEYLCITDWDKNNVLLQDGETIAYNWVTADVICNMSSDELLSERMRQYVKNTDSKAFTA